MCTVAESMMRRLCDTSSSNVATSLLSQCSDALAWLTTVADLSTILAITSELAATDACSCWGRWHDDSSVDRRSEWHSIVSWIDVISAKTRCRRSASKLVQPRQQHSNGVTDSRDNSVTEEEMCHMALDYLTNWHQFIHDMPTTICLHNVTIATLQTGTSDHCMCVCNFTSQNYKSVIKCIRLAARHTQDTQHESTMPQQPTEWTAEAHKDHKYANIPSVLWHCWLGIRKSIRPAKIQLVICLKRGADCLHVVQLMPLHPQTPANIASFQSRLALPFWYRLTQVFSEKRSLNRHISGVVIMLTLITDWRRKMNWL